MRGRRIAKSGGAAPLTSRSTQTGPSDNPCPRLVRYRPCPYPWEQQQGPCNAGWGFSGGLRSQRMCGTARALRALRVRIARVSGRGHCTHACFSTTILTRRRGIASSAYRQKGVDPSVRRARVPRKGRAPRRRRRPSGRRPRAPARRVSARAPSGAEPLGRAAQAPLGLTSWPAACSPSPWRVWPSAVLGEHPLVEHPCRRSQPECWVSRAATAVRLNEPGGDRLGASSSSAAVAALTQVCRAR
jgi:hypothetical protein